MTAYSLMRENRSPGEIFRAVLLASAAVAASAAVLDFGLRESTLEWIKDQVSWSGTAPDHRPPDKGAPPVKAEDPPPVKAKELPPAKPREAPPEKEPVDTPRLSVKVDDEARCRVQLQINGRGPFSFIIDTGAEEVVLTQAQGKRLGMDPATMEADHGSGGWGGGSIEGVFRRVDLRLKDFRLPNFEVAIENETSFGEGLLGITFITRLRRFEVADGQCRLWW